jgi:tetratricopeptide (TPR) repeat protein
VRFKIQHIALLGTVLLATACTSQKNTFVNRLYHNTTAKYNAYFLALEKIREVEENIIAEYEEDYSQLLPVFYPIDSAVIEANNERLQQARELASKAIDWHRISKWVDPSYYLLGKIDYYQGKFDEAQNTFKYLNVNSSQDEVRHLSLIGLLRSFIDLRKFDDAVYVMDYLSKESAISGENRFLLYQTLAYYYESKGEVDMVAPALFRALRYAEERKEISRIHFILGQLYQQAGLDAFAYEYYQKSISGSPSYERTFFASLYSQQVAELSKSKDLRRVRGYYDDLYKDRKNIEFRDVILYEKAIFEYRQDEKNESIRLLTLAAKEPTDNRRQKGYIFEKLADIYLQDFNDFLTTKYYLDSALKQFREGDRNYQALAARKEVFDQYALNFELIQKNDSLISLSRLTLEEQEAYVDEFLRKEEERLLREAEIQRNKKTPSIFDNLLASAGGGSGTSFYWNNPTAMSQGALEFNRVWGGRPLTDNWRRSSRGFQETSNAEMTEDLGGGNSDSENQSITSAQAALNLPDRESLLATIPKDKAAVDRLIDEMEDAYFNLGKLLFFDLKESEQSIFYLEMLVRDYPMTVKKPEAYYTLYLAKRELGQNYNLYADLLNAEFPESQYTKSVNNPESVSGTQANFESSQNYAAAYNLYHEKQYAASKDLLRSTLENYPLTKNTDRLLMLDIMNTGKMGEMEEYRTKLENYLLNASDPALINLARKMLDGIGGGNTMEDSMAEAGQQIEEEAVGAENESNAEPEVPLEEQIYKENKSQTHVFILAMEPRVANESKNLTADLEKFHTSNFPNDRLRTGTIALDRENTIVIISPFSNSEKALLYRTQFLNSFNTENLPEDSKISSFVISIENFQQLNRRKDLDEYRAFFRKSYNE